MNLSQSILKALYWGQHWSNNRGAVKSLTFIWLFKYLSFLNISGQNWHLTFLTFVWTFWMCDIIWVFSANVLSHISHWYGFRPKWTALTCFCIPCLVPKSASQPGKSEKRTKIETLGKIKKSVKLKNNLQRCTWTFASHAWAGYGCGALRDSWTVGYKCHTYAGFVYEQN